jgi:hypothetical protein
MNAKSAQVTLRAFRLGMRPKHSGQPTLWPNKGKAQQRADPVTEYSYTPEHVHLYDRFVDE